MAKDTIKSYRLYTTKFAEWIGEETPLSDITINDIEEYMEYKRLGGNKAVSVATNVRNLRCFFNFCSKRKMMEHLEITMPRYEKELKEPYSDYEMALLLVKPKGDSWTEYRNWAMVNYFFATGQRLSTVIHIRVKDVDLVSKRLLVCCGCKQSAFLHHIHHLRGQRMLPPLCLFHLRVPTDRKLC